MRLILLAAAGALLAASAATLLFGVASGPVEIRLEESRIQQSVDARLPLSGTKAGADWTVTGAEVSVLGNGRIGLAADVVATMAGRAVSFRLTGSGVPLYGDGVFHVGEVLLEDAAYVPGAGQGTAGRLFGAVAATTFGQDIEARALAEATELLVAYLDDTPVYTLPDDMRGNLLRMVVHDVAVSDDAVVVTLAPDRSVAWVLVASGIALLLAALAILWLARRSPGRIS